MLTIDTLQLQLPAGFAHRAERIGRLVADALARIQVGADGADLAIDCLALPEFVVAQDASDVEIAAGIARSVRQEIASARRQGDR